MSSRPPLAARLLLVPAIVALLAGCQSLKQMLPAEQAQAPDQSALLVGSLWIASQIGDRVATEDPRVTVAFYGDGRMVGKGGCNTYTGRYVLDGMAMQVSALKAGKSACDAPIVDQEQAFLAALAAASHYEIKPEALQPNGVLVLTDAAGQELRFHRDTTETVQVLDYTCEGGAALHVIFDWPHGVASISENGGVTTTLSKVPTATGFRFEAAPQSFVGQGSDAQWSAAGDAPVACKVAG